MLDLIKTPRHENNKNSLNTICVVTLSWLLVNALLLEPSWSQERADGKTNITDSNILSQESKDNILNLLPALPNKHEYYLEKLQDGHFAIKIRAVSSACKPQVPNNPLYLSAGSGRGGNPIAEFPKNNASLTLGVREIQTSPANTDNLKFISILWQPDPCVPFRVGLEHTEIQSKLGGPYNIENLVGLSFGVNPSGNVVFINRVGIDGNQSIGISGSIQYSFPLLK